jgi:hypothetical protein
VEAFEAYLEVQGILVEEVLETEGIIEVPMEEVDEEAEEPVVDEGDVEEGPVEVPIVELEYVIEEQVEEGAVHTIGIVAGAYAALIEAGHDSELLEATVLNPADAPFGLYEIETTWAEEYNAGEISAAEYADEILVTVETE